MALGKVIEEVQRLSTEEKYELLHILEEELDIEEDPLEDFIGSVKRLTCQSKGSIGFEEDLYGGSKPL